MQTLKSLAFLFLCAIAIALSPLARGQSTTPSTTFTIAATESAATVTLASGAGISTGTVLWHGREGMTVVSLVSGTTYNVIRGTIGHPQNHAVGSQVYIVAPGANVLIGDDKG